jgi:hypothetical protein
MTPTVPEVMSLLRDAMKLGLQVPPGSDPAAWRDALDGLAYPDLQRALVALSRDTAFLSIAGLVKACPKPGHPGEAAWDRIVARVKAGGRREPIESAPGCYRNVHSCKDLLDEREYAAFQAIGGYEAVVMTAPEFLDRKRAAFLAALDRQPGTLPMVAH